ncbi:MAG: 30S ribosomal protein S13 [Minisyncoccia bacterium]|jgi:small subunit ribosomal protein S13
MVRIAGVEIPNEKRILFALPKIYGIGRSLAKKICETLNIDPMKKTKELTMEEISKIEKYIDENLKVEGDLRREIQANIRRLIDIQCYRGLRHLRKLPVWGQRTRTNARTRKGPRKTVGSGKRKVSKK